MDALLGCVLAMLVAPIIVVLAVISAVLFRAWPFFRQPRSGRNGHTIRVVKIRSLHTTASTTADKHELQHMTINRFGQFIRRHHLDELPQLWQVTTGRMSLVGPRPEMPHILERFQTDHREQRAPFRPGCTGLWQISVARAGMMYEAPEYDAFYARHHSLRMDLWILWRTLLQGAGARQITLDDVPSWVCGGPHLLPAERFSDPTTSPLLAEEPLS
jgi:lipopolysaccharide/colanic/teichoic acid biosynthesis glycosyltransferase